MFVNLAISENGSIFIKVLQTIIAMLTEDKFIKLFRRADDFVSLIFNFVSFRCYAVKDCFQYWLSFWKNETTVFVSEAAYFLIKSIAA